MAPSGFEKLPVTPEDILAAHDRIRPYIHQTPLLSSSILSRSVGCDLRLKAEHLQRSGSFKLRGALNKLLCLSKEQRARGVVAFSSGNHAQGLALAARIVGCQATIVMPHDAPSVKLEATREYGAQVVLYDRYNEDRESITEQLVQERGLTLVPPFDDPHIIAGQGTIGLEISACWPELDTVLVPVGGGGLISGIAVAVKSRIPQAQVVGVEPAVADDARRSLQSDKIVRIDPPRTLADGVATTSIGKHTFVMMRALLDGIVTVSESEIMRSLELLMTRTKQVLEPTGALSTAAALFGKVDVRNRNVVSILCGGNVDLRRLAHFLPPVALVIGRRRAYAWVPALMAQKRERLYTLITTAIERHVRVGSVDLRLDRPKLGASYDQVGT